MMPESFLENLMFFTKDILGSYSVSADLLALALIEKFFPDTGIDVETRRLNVMGIQADSDVTEALLASLFLDNLKAGTTWIVKLANIDYMFKLAKRGDSLMHIATHFVNLIKVSETIIVRKRAGRRLVELADNMPREQLNELCIELFNGLELGDYQFIKFIPGYLGQLMLHLPDEELDEMIAGLETLLNTGNDKSAAASLNTVAVLLENYDNVSPDSSSTEEHKQKLLGLIVKSH